MSRRLERAQERLVEATAGAALCRTDNRNDAKETEGRVVALRAAHRALAAGADEPALLELLAKWRTDLDVGVGGREWLAYLRGGIEELEWTARQASDEGPVTGCR